MKNVIRFMLTFIVSLFVFASCNDFAKKSQVAVTASLEPVFSLVQPYFNQLNNSTQKPEVYYRFQSEVFYGDESVQKLIKEEPFSCDPNDKSWVNQTIFISDLEVGKEYKVDVEFSFVDYSSNNSTITEGDAVVNTTNEFPCAAGSVKFTASSDPKQTETLVLGFIRDISLTSNLDSTATDVLYSSSNELINFSAQASRKIDSTLEYLFRIAGNLEGYTVDKSELYKNFEWQWFVNSQELIPPSGDETFKLESVGNDSNLFISFLKIWELGVDTSKPHYNDNGEDGKEFVVSCKISSSVTGYVYESNPFILYLKPPVDVQMGTNVVDYNADVNMRLVAYTENNNNSVAEGVSSSEFDKFYNATSECIKNNNDKTLIYYTKISGNENFILSVNISDKVNVENGVISTIVGSNSEVDEYGCQFNNPQGAVSIYIYKDGNELDLTANSPNSFVSYKNNENKLIRIVSTPGKKDIWFNILFGSFKEELDLQEHTITIKVVKSDTGVVIGTNTIKYQAVSN